MLCAVTWERGHPAALAVGGRQAAGTLELLVCVRWRGGQHVLKDEGLEVRLLGAGAAPEAVVDEQRLELRHGPPRELRRVRERDLCTRHGGGESWTRSVTVHVNAAFTCHARKDLDNCDRAGEITP